MTKNLKKQLFPQKYAKELLKIAEGDLDSAVGLAKIKTGRPENIVFIAQQSVEKSIKAVLVHLQIALLNIQLFIRGIVFLFDPRNYSYFVYFTINARCLRGVITQLLHPDCMRIGVVDA